MLILRADATVDYTDLSPEALQQLLEKYQAWSSNLAQRGLLVDGKKLQDSGGKVMLPDGKGGVRIKDCPYQETKDVVGGFYLLKADSYEQAVQLTRGHPNFQFGSI